MHRSAKALLVLITSAALAGGVIVSPASASTTRTIKGYVSCAYHNKVVGVWVDSSKGGSRFADWKADSVFKEHATFTTKIKSTSSKTSIRLDVGCGGSRKDWKTKNSTPRVTVSGTGTRTLSVICREKKGKRAQRCKYIPNPVSSAVMTRARSWVDAHVPYNQGSYYKNKYGTYRQDCSGFVSMAWGLKGSETTPTLPGFASPITKMDLRPGDILLNAAPGNAGHVAIFVKWANSSRTSYVSWEENGAAGKTIQQTIPYPYLPNVGTFKPYRRH